jgi:hypothetical protein
VTPSSPPEAPSGLALLVGAPLGNLGGVDESIACLGGLLEARGFAVTRLVGPTARRAEIMTALEHLRERVQPGDAVVLYWAGHGDHAWDRGKPGAVFPMLLPMDAAESTADDPRAILGIELAQWLAEVAAAAAHEGVTNVTAILECCHATGLIDDQGLDAAGLHAARRTVGADIEARVKSRRRSTPAALEQQIVRVVASGTFARAYGDTIGTVGAVTHTLVELLERHPHEPWRALVHRLRAQIHARQPQQQPGVEGRRDRIPFTTAERSLPTGALPCLRDEAGRWRCELGELLAARGGALYRLTDDLDAPGGTLARMDEGRAWLHPLEPDDAPPGTMRWALPVELARGLRVELREAAEAPLSVALRQGLEGAGVVLKRATGAARLTPSPNAAPAIVLERRPRATVLVDAWGEPVVQWEHEPALDTVLPWVSRLSELHRWLALAQTPSSLLTTAFALRWGVRGPDDTIEALAPGEPATLPDGAAVWLELHNLGVEPRLFLSVFRVTGDRAVEHLTAASAGGLPSTTSRPARLGLGDRRVVLSRTVAGLDAASEALVSIVTLRPLPLHGLERGAIARDLTTPTTPARAMMVSRYRIVDPP